MPADALAPLSLPRLLCPVPELNPHATMTLSVAEWEVEFVRLCPVSAVRRHGVITGCPPLNKPSSHRCAGQGRSGCLAAASNIWPGFRPRKLLIWVKGLWPFLTQHWRKVEWY